MEKTRDSEKSQRIISFHWREEAMLKRRLSSLESMKRQVELSFCLDQRILYSRFQSKLRRSAQTWARTTSDDELIWRLAGENFPFNMTMLTNDRERSVSKLAGMAHGHRLGSFGSCTPAVPGGYRSTSAPGPPRTVLSGNTKCKSSQPGGIPPERTRSQSSKPSFQRVAFPPSQHLSSPALPLLKRPAKSRPITTTVAFQDSKELLGKPQPKEEESGETAGEAVKDDQQTPAAKACSESTSKRSQDLSPKHERPDDPAVQISGREEAEGVRSEEEEPSAAGTGGPQLAVKVSRFVEKVKNMKHHEGCIMSDYYAHKLSRSPSSGKETLRVTEEDRERWCLVGGERASRSITMAGLDTARPTEELSADLLILETYGALLTRENRVERNWIDNDPYSTTAGPSASP